MHKSPETVCLSVRPSVDILTAEPFNCADAVDQLLISFVDGLDEPTRCYTYLFLQCSPKVS